MKHILFTALVFSHVVAFAKVELSTTNLSFSSVEVGEQSPLNTVFVTNIGTEPAQLMVSNSCSADFRIGSNCNLTLSPDAFCTIDTQFIPTQEGTQMCEVFVNDLVEGTQTLSLNGNGVR